jgi:hypothetical protein
MCGEECVEASLVEHESKVEETLVDEQRKSRWFGMDKVRKRHNKQSIAGTTASANILTNLHTFNPAMMVERASSSINPFWWCLVILTLRFRWTNSLKMGPVSTKDVKLRLVNYTASE